MKKNLYYEGVFARKNIIKEFTLLGFGTLVSWPRMLLEVFIRKNFGERYFSFAQTICLSIFLSFGPVIIAKYNFMEGDLDYSIGAIILKNITWYLFLLRFYILAIKGNL